MNPHLGTNLKKKKPWTKFKQLMEEMAAIKIKFKKNWLVITSRELTQRCWTVSDVVLNLKEILIV